ncbi:MAG: hypothetical protein BroJett018_51480 [Chloroflexota bacterium]|nr:MAG: hypothetical protein BroJett018_51480 [Chloroflexota bacterium]
MADNRYELHALIGEGGQGRVFQAFDRLTNHTVARLDELRPAIVNALGEPEAEKLLDEARAMTLDALAMTVVEHFADARVSQRRAGSSS